MNHDIRQSPLFAHFMQSIGWQIIKHDKHIIYLRKFPFIGSFAKIPRPSLPVSSKSLVLFKKENNIFCLKIAPFINSKHPHFQKIRERVLKSGFRIDISPFNPTTTIQIDLKSDEQVIFQNFSQEKRRAIRRAVKHGVVIRESDNIGSFIKIRQDQYKPFGFLVTNETRAVFDSFYPKNATLLLAYQTKQSSHLSPNVTTASIRDEAPVGGILLLSYDKIAYYWFATALPIGKKLFAPSLLVWEALKTAKRNGCIVFDFEGIYDLRFPKASKAWRGFTQFKEGFGGKTVVYMENFSK